MSNPIWVFEILQKTLIFPIFCKGGFFSAKQPFKKLANDWPLEIAD